VSKQVLADSNN